MGRVYVYGAAESDLTTVGIAGALLPTECTFNIKAGEFGELTLVHPRDPYGKWRELLPERIIKAPVPVRVCPAFDDDNTYVTEVYKYKVSLTASADERRIWTGKGETKKYTATLKPGQSITAMKEYNPTYERYKITAKIGKKKYTGWVEAAAVDAVGAPAPIPITDGSLEDVESSYAIKDQLFRIISVDKTDDMGGSITVKAMRIAYDLSGVPTDMYEKTTVTGKQAARDTLDKALVQDTGFEIYSDVGTERIGINLRYKSVIEALCDPEAGICAMYDAQIVSDDYDIYVLNDAGVDRGVEIRYAKNLTGINCSADTSGMYDGVLPVGESDSGAPLLIDANTPIPAGFHRGSGGKDKVIFRDGAERTPSRIYVYHVSDAKADKKGGVSADNVRKQMAVEAVKLFNGGIDTAKLALDVNFIMLGDADEYRQYRHLDSLFIYDTVRIHHFPLGIIVTTTLTELTWDCLKERVIEAHFGELADMSPTISSYQLSGVDGMKITPGSIGGIAIGDGSIKVDHMQAESVNAQAMQTESFTAQTAIVQTLNALAIAATTANIHNLTADMVDTKTLTANSIISALAAFDILRAATANLDEAHIKALFAETGITDQQTITDLYAAHIRTNYLTAGRAVIEQCVLKSDGEYYRVQVGAGGTLTATKVTVTPEEQEAGMTADGHTLIENEDVYEALSTGNFKAIYGAINELYSSIIVADKFFARESVLQSLETSRIFGTGGAVEIIAKAAAPKVYRQESEPALTGSIPGSLWVKPSTGVTYQLTETEGVRAWELVQDSAIAEAQAAADKAQSDLERVVRIDTQGVHVGDNQTDNEVMIQSESVNLKVGNEIVSSIGQKKFTIGNLSIYETDDGGAAFVRE